MNATMRALKRRPFFVLIAAALAVAGCGGGGGNVRPSSTPPPSTPSTPPAPPPPQPDFDSHLALTNTYAAHNAGYTGAGVTIGMVDTGINTTHPALQGRVKASLLYVDPATNDTSKGDVVGHGTMTSEVAAGVPFGSWPGGIAPGATLVSARIISDKPPADDGSGQGNAVEASDGDFFGQYLLPDLIDQGVQIMNNSWGGLYWNPDHPATVAAGFADAFRPFVVDHDGLVVFATGNEGQTQPSDTASLPYYAPELERGWLAVAALDTLHPTQLADYSNACGKAMDYCLVAPGDVVVTGADDTAGHPTYWVVSGTSFSTPTVAGAAAVVWQAFPYFNNDMVRQTLLGTAKDLGATGVDPVFGYGLLDVGKAVNGPAQFNWGDVSVDFSAGRSTWSNDIRGAGGLVKSGDGTLVLAGSNSYQGDTTVQGGTLEAAGAFPGNVIVGSAGRLSGVYAEGTPETGMPGVQGNLDNAGVVVVKGGPVAVAGNYHQASTGFLNLNLGSRLDVAGTATLDGGTLAITGADSGYVANSHENLVTAAGGLSGAFDQLTLASGVFLSSTLQYDANDVWIDTTGLSVTTTAAASGFGAQPAVMGSARRVDATFAQLDSSLASGAAVSSGLISGAGAIQHTPTLAAAQRSLQSLSGQLHAASTAMTFEAIDAGTRALSDRFDSLVEHPLAGAWSQNLGYQGGMSHGGYDPVGFQLNGSLFGQDLRVGNRGVVGFAAAQSQGLGQLAESADQGHSHAMEGMLYGGVVGERSYAMGRIGVGHYRENMRRHIQLGYLDSPVASQSSGSYDVAYAESGLHLDARGTRLTPYVDLQYARIQRGGFNEPGAYGFGLKANAQTVQRWQAGLGLRAAHQWTLAHGGSLQLTGRLQWQQSFGLRGDVFDASFTGIDQWAPLGGVGLSRYGGVAGMGVDWSFSPRSMLQFGMDQHFAQREHGSMTTLNYRLAF